MRIFFAMQDTESFVSSLRDPTSRFEAINSFQIQRLSSFFYTENCKSVRVQTPVEVVKVRRVKPQLSRRRIRLFDLYPSEWGQEKSLLKSPGQTTKK